MYGKTFSENDSVHSHSEESIAMLDELLKTIEITHSCVNCKAHSTLLRDVEPDSVRFVFQHIRESIEAYGDLCNELEDDKDEIRHEYEEKVVQFINRFMNSDLADEMTKQVKVLESDCEHFYNLAISRNKELERECEKSNQLEVQVKELQYRYDELKKECSNWKDLCITWQKESAKDYKRSNQLEKRCKDLEHQLKELEAEIDFLRSEDTDSAEPNNPSNFCGNCKFFEIHADGVGICNNKHTDPFIVDPDDASCKFFKPTYDETRVVIGKPEFPVCEKCNRDDCDDCTLCPF